MDNEPGKPGIMGLAVGVLTLALLFAVAWEFVLQDFVLVLLGLPKVPLDLAMRVYYVVEIVAFVALALIIPVYFYGKADKARQTSERWLRTFIDQMPNPISLKDQAGRYVIVNRMFNHWFNPDNVPVTELTAADFVPANHADEVAVMDEAVKNTARMITKESLVPAADGGWRPMLMQKFPMLDTAGNAFGIGTIETDLSDIRFAESALRRSEETYRTLVQNSPLCIHEIGLDGRVISMNPAGLKMMGVAREQDVCGLEYVSLPVPEDRDRISDLLNLARNGESTRFEFRTPGRDGLLYFSSNFVPIVGEDGEVLRIMGVTEDITGRKKVDGILRESEQRFRALYQQSPLGVSVEDYSGVKRMIDRLRGQGVNDFEQYFSDNPKDLKQAVEAVRLIDVNDTQIDMFKMPDKDAYREYEQQFGPARDVNWSSFYIGEFSAFANDRTTYSGDVTDIHADGTQLEVRCVSRILKSDENDWSQVVSTHEDITTRRRLDRALRRSEEKHRQFAADVAHELRTPLAVLRTQIDNQKSAKIKEALIPDVESLTHLVERILTMTRLDTVDIGPEERADLTQVCTNVAAHLTPLAARHGHAVEVVGAEQPVDVRGNSEALEQAVRNLLENAIRHADPGTPVSIHITDEPSIRVTNSGKSIPPEQREVIFQRFERADRHSGGAGLGLSIVQRVVKAHDGTVDVADAPGGGCVFTIRFPLQPVRRAVAS